MKTNLVSIIVPYYNTPIDYWQKCLDSLKSQTYVDIEIVVVDDGSKKEFAEALDLTRVQDSRLVVYHKPNGGVSSARNYAIDKCIGDLLCFVDSDDWVEPDFIQTLVDSLNSTGKRMGACNWIAETGILVIPNLTPTTPQILSQKEAYKALICSTGIMGFLCNKIFEKNLVTQRLDENLYYCEDLVFNSHYLKNVDGITFVDRQLYHYRQTGGNATSDFSFNHKIFTLIKAYQSAESIYHVQVPEMCYILRKNILKIALNFRARIKYNKIKEPETVKVINQTIRDYKDVLYSKVSIFEKINIILTWIFPVTMFKLKNKMLNRKI